MDIVRSRGTVPEIIALDFYDGPTEGYALDLRDHGPCYFRMIAWGDDQDERLFAATKADRASIDKLIELLGLDEEKLGNAVCVPRWRFQTSGQEKQADDIVTASQNNLRSSGFLILGNSITSEHAVEIEYEGDLAKLVCQSLAGVEIGKLENWLQYFHG